MEREHDKNLPKYRQLSAEKRRKIEAHLNLHFSISKASKLINRPKPTVFGKD